MSEPDELFDVVDEHNRVIEVMSRREVHQLGLRHRAVHVFLFRSDGRLLIHLRAASKVEFPSVWSSSAAGHVTSGENPDDCVRRELAEELGLDAKLKFCLEIPACPQTCMEFTRLYLAVSDDEIHPDPGEISDTRWLQLDEVQKQIQALPDQFSPAFRLVFEQYTRWCARNSPD